jgi:hypothetical protein
MANQMWLVQNNFEAGMWLLHRAAYGSSDSWAFLSITNIIYIAQIPMNLKICLNFYDLAVIFMITQ